VKKIVLVIVVFAISGFIGLGMSRFPDVFNQYNHLSSLFLTLVALSSYITTIKWFGLRKGGMIVASISVFAFFIETFALITGFPYGEFTYSDDLGGKIFGLAPWTIFFGWTPFVLASAVISRKYYNENKWRFILLNTMFLVIIDLVLDPAAVALGYWSYSNPSFYYDVALMNYFGWFISGFIGSTIFYYLSKDFMDEEFPVMMMSSAFLILTLWSFALLGLGLYFPGLLGLIITIYFAFLITYNSPNPKKFSNETNTISILEE
jgi:bisanhydrobacterioruberin hydratase